MRPIKVRFRRDQSLDCIDVLVRAPERDRDTEALLARIAQLPPEQLTVTGEDGAVHRLAREDIVFVSVEGNRARIVTEKGNYSLRQSLQSLESQLDGERFVRVSRYELVNMDKIVKYDFTVNGTLRLELTGGMETWASRRCIPAIRKRLNGKE